MPSKILATRWLFSIVSQSSNDSSSLGIETMPPANNLVDFLFRRQMICPA